MSLRDDLLIDNDLVIDYERRAGVNLVHRWDWNRCVYPRRSIDVVLDQMRDALNKFTNNNDYEVWFDVHAAMKWLVQERDWPASLCFKLWDEWSAGCPKYKASSQIFYWENMGTSGKYVWLRDYAAGVYILACKECPDDEQFTGYHIDGETWYAKNPEAGK